MITPTPEQIRARLVFDVERLRDASARLEKVDQSLLELRRRLEARARVLAREATGEARIELGGSGRTSIRYAQAHATANLARRASLGDVLSPATCLSLIAAMATSRWVAALRSLTDEPRGEAAVRSRIEAGRIACRLLVSFRRGRGLSAGAGQLTSAVVVAELVHPSELPFVHEQIEEGLDRSLRHRKLTPDAVIELASKVLREAAYLLERIAAEAEPTTRRLLEEADVIEQKVEADLSARR